MCQLREQYLQSNFGNCMHCARAACQSDVPKGGAASHNQPKTINMFGKEQFTRASLCMPATRQSLYLGQSAVGVLETTEHPMNWQAHSLHVNLASHTKHKSRSKERISSW